MLDLGGGRSEDCCHSPGRRGEGWRGCCRGGGGVVANLPLRRQGSISKSGCVVLCRGGAVKGAPCGREDVRGEQ